MKFLTIILAVYFLGLNFVPCGDISFEDSKDCIEISQTADSPTDADHEHDSEDECSPFCQCHCCHVHTIDIGSATVALIEPGIFKEDFAHNDSFGKDVFIALFEPPRV